MNENGDQSRLIRELIEGELPSLIALRHDLHAHPEIGHCETRTSATVQRELSAAGVEFQSGVGGGTGVLAHISGSDGAAIGLRADLDALPIAESTALPYASVFPGKMHACGHDGHTTILIGVARILAKLGRIAPLTRPVTLLFQPAEENLGGASKMIEDGCLAGRLGPPVSEIYGLHCWPWLPIRSVGVRDGPILAATDSFTVTIHGRGSHAAWPHLSNDPIVAIASVITALQSIVSRNTDPVDAVVVSVCTIRAGDAFNVIPQEGVIGGTMRTLSASSRALTLRRIEEISDHAAKMHDCFATVEIQRGCPATINDPVATRSVRRAVAQMAGTRLVEMKAPFMGGEDFAHYGEAIPASFFLLGIQDLDAPPSPPLHHPKFDFNDSAIAVGIEAMCLLAIGKPLN